jgi:hypothetical protein
MFSIYYTVLAVLPEWLRPCMLKDLPHISMSCDSCQRHRRVSHPDVHSVGCHFCQRFAHAHEPTNPQQEKGSISLLDFIEKNLPFRVRDLVLYFVVTSC